MITAFACMPLRLSCPRMFCSHACQASAMVNALTPSHQPRQVCMDRMVCLPRCLRSLQLRSIAVWWIFSVDSVLSFPLLFLTIDSSRTPGFAGVEGSNGLPSLTIAVAAVKVEGVWANKQGGSLVWVFPSLFGDTMAP